MTHLNEWQVAREEIEMSTKNLTYAMLTNAGRADAWAAYGYVVMQHAHLVYAPLPTAEVGHTLLYRVASQLRRDVGHDMARLLYSALRKSKYADVYELTDKLLLFFDVYIAMKELGAQ